MAIYLMMFSMLICFHFLWKVMMVNCWGEWPGLEDGGWNPEFMEEDLFPIGFLWKWIIVCVDILMIFVARISFGGIPNSRNVLFLQIFLKRAAKPSAGNTSAGFPWIKWSQILLNLTWLCTKASQTFSGTFSGTPPKPPEPSPEPSPEPCWT